MVKEGIVLDHKISKNRIEVDESKVDVIAKLPHPTTVKGDFAIGAVLGQRKTKHFQPIHYASKIMTDAQAHYTTMKKELLAVVYAFEKFRSYLVIKSLGGVFMARKQLIFSRLSIIDPPGDIMARTTLPKSVKERSCNEMKGHKTPSKFVKFFTFGALISWGYSRLQEGISLELPVPSSATAVRTSAMTSLQRLCLSTMSLTGLLLRITLKQVDRWKYQTVV
nr:DNA-directed DNA polymerase [Tanacetum cinerariifolium]